MFSFKYPGRNTGIVKFEIKQPKYVYILDPPQQSDYLIHMRYNGAIQLKKSTNKTQSYCNQKDEHVNYHGIQNALLPDSMNKEGKFTPKRFTIIQMQ